MINPVTLTLTTAAAAAAGYSIGLVARRNLDRLGYRTVQEHQQPAPPPRRWAPWITAAAAASLTTAAMLSTQPLLMVTVAPLVATGAWLAGVDLDVQRLPNRVTGATATATMLLVIIVAVLLGNAAVAILSLLGCVLASAVVLVSHFVTRGGIGMGDVKLAAIVGVALGHQGPNAVTVSLVIGSVAAILWSKAAKHTGPLAYGPWLLLGAWTASALSGLIR